MKKFFYRCQQSDSIFSVCEKFGISALKLIRDNDLKQELQEGDVIYIEITDKKLYRVRASDSLQSIAQKFSVCEEQILKDNNIPYIFYGLIIEVE